MATKEIITLQLGNYANFIGAHWWNIQESSFEYEKLDTGTKTREDIDHDVLFREGVTNRGEVTFTPRLVLTELKGGLGSMREDSVLYEDKNSNDDVSTLWDEETAVYQQPLKAKNRYLKSLETSNESEYRSKSHADMNTRTYDFEKDVKVWSDYMRTYLHPKSTLIVNEYLHESPNNPFDLITKGSTLNHVIEGLEERVRFYAEECDALQGFHMIVDSDSGFSGLSSSLLPYLKDEFYRKNLICFPVNPAIHADDSMSKLNIRKLNMSLVLPELLENSSLVCPLSLESKNETDFPGLIYDINLNYHTSAIISSALDTFTLNYRLKGALGSDLNIFCSQLVTGPRKLVCASTLFPFDCQQNRAFLNQFFSRPINLASITPNICTDQKSVENFSHVMTARGLSEEKSRCAIGSSQQTSNLYDILDSYLASNYYGAKRYACILKNSMKTNMPYPQFFKRQVQNFNGHCKADESSSIHTNHKVNGNSNGYTNGHSRITQTSVPVLTSLECSSKVSGILNYAATCLRTNRKKCASYGVEAENLDSYAEYLMTEFDEYRSVSNGGSDSDCDS